MALNLLSGGQHTVASAGATLDLLEQHFISLSRLHLNDKRTTMIYDIFLYF